MRKIGAILRLPCRACGRPTKINKPPGIDNDLCSYCYTLRGEDFKRISEINKLWSNDEELDSDDDELFDEFDKVQYVRSYEEPKTDRPLNELLNNYLIWEMSKEERLKLRNYWHAKLDEENLLSLQEEHEDCRQNMNDIYDDARRQILLSKDVIGMTTSGAAKFQNLIKYVDPKIIICEEAGEVLEAHILSALTPSTQHLILIGDHNQLRPHVASYSLSIESYIGENYQLDKSLFERFVDDLEDGENTIDYPDIRGAQHNVYFIDHKNPESKSNNDSAMQSHVNMYEVKMVVEMVKYFVKYGYTKPEDIAVLTPYLGQMSKIREALSESFAVDIDERDAQDMGEMDEEKIQTSKPLNQRVTLRTVDNFQGEEANIVIVSLVRNYSGNNKYSSIGFLRSKNRSNVLLSRAREGMYLIGNAKLMASKSKEMWATVVEILRKRDQVGPGMPIVCKHHPDSKTIITKPEQFDEFCSPNGGCRSICDMPLPCGHTCTDECHFNNLDHKGFICRQPCNKLHSECGHQCPKLCYKDCDICNVALGNIILPCGHIFKNAKCWQNENKEEIKCITTIDIVLPDCEHPLQNVECWRVQNNEKFICQFPINITLPDCGHPLQNVECWRVQNNEKFTCHFPVDIPLPCGHILPNVQCWKRKFKETLECYKIIDVTLPDCGHLIRNIECWSAKDREKSTCDEPVDTILPCGHMQNVKCWKNKNKEKIKCNTIIDIVLPKCGHPYKNVECWRVQNKEKFICKFEMDITLSDCGHPYPNVECWRVQSKELFSCRVKINMILPCGHILRDECGKKHVKETLKCNTLIDKTLSCGHMSKGVECWRVQNEEELICRSLVDITLPCGHTLRNAECWQNKTKETIRCDTIFDTVSPDCGHPLQNVECWRVQNKEEFTCDFLVDIEYSDCEHSFRVKCRKKDKIKKIPKCHHLVDFELPCGHISKYVECWTAKENEPIKCNKSIDFKLPCGHLLKNIKCWESQIEYRPKCNVISDITFPCGHTAENVECWEKGIIKCMEQITIKMPHCEHTGDVRCSESANDIKCKKNCGKQLKCERTKHGKCRTRCKKLLYCGHICGQFCHKGECQPCNNECALSCEHKKACNKDCLEPCAVCAKKCSWECRHQEKCELSCGIPCNRLPCNKRCDKKTKCGHACAGICGEICPLYCADVNCAPKKIRNQVSDIINNITFSNINWNKERMIALPCGHIYTMKSMDTLMEMGNYYDGSIDGGWTSVRLFPNSTSIKTCPACQAPVKDIRRYGRIIKKHILDMQNRKFVSKYDDELKKIDKRIVNSSNEMTKKRSNLKDELCDISEFKPRKEFKDKNRGLPEIAPYNYFELIAQYHGFDENSQQVWLSHVSKLLRCYDKLISIIRVAKSSPHKKAFEASSNVRGGSKGDLPFISELDQRIHLIYLDGVLKIINIQKLLYDEILFVIQELSSITKDVTNIKDLWKGFAERLQKSIQTHLCLIKNVAESTDYGKYSLLAKVEILEFDFTMLRNSPNDYASIMRKRDDIERTITNITNSSNFINVEGEFKKGIQDRLIRLWRSCDDIL
ncbi:hypothetical protein RclHR1_08010001 [Rhizophagus clarus]|uniref:NF-X1-type domain-containing protein n=1 Tax=Rhizophagus clarus TaxID=94130 RepID=A0A2Z6S1F5_9GLOM|nr:hypothetical protein RclHR1_08010001 [Rhizophagus clarus]